jgi:hypothetical protein
MIETAKQTARTRHLARVIPLSQQRPVGVLAREGETAFGPLKQVRLPIVG